MSEAPLGCELGEVCKFLSDSERIGCLPVRLRHKILTDIGEKIIANEDQVDLCFQQIGENCIAWSDVTASLIMDDSIEFVTQELERKRVAKVIS